MKKFSDELREEVVRRIESKKRTVKEEALLNGVSTATYLSIGEVARELCVCVATVRRWCKLGKLAEAYRTVGNHRRFSNQAVSNLKRTKSDNRQVIGYARVSSHDQKPDLETQALRLKDYGCDLVLQDLGSGLNCKNIYADRPAPSMMKEFPLLSYKNRA